ncbi:phage antirepressor KilAC domain-containing protein [Streptomyces sp. NPDC059718]
MSVPPLNPTSPSPDGNNGGPFEIGSFDFHAKPVTVLSNNTGNWAVLGQLCRILTLDSEGQRQALARKSWSRGRTCVVQVQLPGDTQARQHVLIHERIVPMWMANITASRIDDDIVRASVEEAQVELTEALAEYVSRRAVLRREPTKLELARDLVSALEAKEALEAANKVLAPKASKWEKFLSTEGLIGMTNTADLFGTHVKGLTGWLVELNIFRRQVSQRGGARNLPRTAYQDAGYFKVVMETTNGVSHPTAYVTAKGLDLIADLWEKRAAA